MEKEEILKILKAYEELINLDRALSEALDGGEIGVSNKYKNLWDLPIVLQKYSRFKTEEEYEQFISIAYSPDFSAQEKYDLLF